MKRRLLVSGAAFALVCGSAFAQTAPTSPPGRQHRAISIVDPTGKQLLWATEAGDRSLFFSVAHRGGERKVAERIVRQLLKVTH
jgi:hypothetical protein